MLTLAKGQKQEQPNYTGKLDILVDEVTQSHAEFTATALRVVPGARVSGSTTAGANGIASTIVLSGGLRTNIRHLLPRLTADPAYGIVAEVPANPTVHGFHAGQDEALEAGLGEILGDSADEAKIPRLARR